MDVNMKTFSDGAYMLFRQSGTGVGENKRLSKYVGGQRIPHFRHKTREAAEAEAARLLELFPDSTFVIWQEVARVKRAPAIEAAA